MTAAIPSKRCSICREVKPLADFHARARSRDGRQFKCKSCALRQRADWRAARGQDADMKKAARQRTKQWREQNPDRALAARNAWAAANSDKMRASLQRFRERNPDYDRQRLTENPGLVAAYAGARRARLLKATPPWADKEAILAFYREAKRRTEETGIRWHVDHVIPLKNRYVCGLHVETNLQLLTAEENSKKRNRFVVE